MSFRSDVISLEPMHWMIWSYFQPFFLPRKTFVVFTMFQRLVKLLFHFIFIWFCRFPFQLPMSIRMLTLCLQATLKCIAIKFNTIALPWFRPLPVYSFIRFIHDRSMVSNETIQIFTFNLNANCFYVMLNPFIRLIFIRTVANAFRIYRSLLPGPNHDWQRSVKWKRLRDTAENEFTEQSM